MKPSQIYRFPVAERHTNKWDLLPDRRDFYENVDVNDFSDNTINTRLVNNVIHSVCFDGERSWTLGYLSLDNQPFLIYQNAGRGGYDHYQSFITDAKLFKECELYLISLKAINEENGNHIFDVNAELPDALDFYSHSLFELKPELRKFIDTGKSYEDCVVLANAIKSFTDDDFVQDYLKHDCYVLNHSFLHFPKNTHLSRIIEWLDVQNKDFITADYFKSLKK